MTDRPFPIEWRTALRDSALSPTARFVALALSTYMNRDGEARPSQARLASDTGLALSTVKAKFVELEEAGWLAAVGRRGGTQRGGKRETNTWHGLLPTVDNQVPRTGPGIGPVLPTARTGPTDRADRSDSRTPIDMNRDEESVLSREQIRTIVDNAKTEARRQRGLLTLRHQEAM